MGQDIDVRVWGTRGSMTAPYPDRMMYGANTSCISAEWENGMIIFDCGSGIRALGMELSERAISWSKKEIHIFIGHLHLDHIIGLPFLPLIYNKEWTIHLYGTSERNTTFQEALNLVAGPPYWPVRLEHAGAAICWHQLKSGDVVELPDKIKVRVLRANHPDSTVIFKLEKEDVHIVYGLDYELTEECRKEYEEFVKDSALLFFDGMYTEEELPRYRGFGHSSLEQGIRLLESCSIDTLCITHHDWGRTDFELEKIEEKVQNRHPDCIFAREGMVFRFKAGGMEHEY